jgi:hypothetical protein
MNLQAWIAAVSVVVAAAAFVFSLWTKRRDERRSSIRDWQRVVVYTIIEENGPLQATGIQALYIQKAQQLLSFKVSRNELQEDALRRILLDLQRDGVVVRLENMQYQIQCKIPMESWAYEELIRTFNERKLKVAIRRIIEGGSGKYTVEGLARMLHDQGLEVSYEDLDSLVYDLRGYSSLKLNKTGTLEFVPPVEERDSS